jgi:4'-phosphopantetheinyl transferase
VFWHGNAIPVEISLSHRNGTAVCAIGPRNASFGCDVELVENRDSVFVTDYFTPEEQEAVRQVPDRDQSRVITVIWSTKESALKALRTGLRLDTRSIAVQMNDSLISCGFNNGNTSEWTSVAASGPEREIFVGWFRLDGELVKTLLSAMPVSCPTPLFPITVDRSVEQRHPPQRLRWDKLPVNSFAARKEV